MEGPGPPELPGPVLDLPTIVVIRVLVVVVVIVIIIIRI